jgi:hypothetical protein
MNKWKLILGLCLAVLIMAATPFTVMAAGNNNNRAAAGKAARMQLVIVQPRVVRVGQDLQLTVLARFNQNSVSAAEVWSVDQTKIKGVKEAVQVLISSGSDNVTLQDYIDILKANGSQLGQTDAQGKLTSKFTTAANYCLVALKEGYRPGYSYLAVREVLSVSAVKKAAPNEVVTISVIQKQSTQAVAGAGVWAVEFSNAKDLKDKLADLRKNNQKELANVDWNSALNNLATSLGTTDIAGQVKHSFSSGKYLLIAVKNGCLPAYTGIVILEPRSAVN